MYIRLYLKDCQLGRTRERLAGRHIFTPLESTDQYIEVKALLPKLPPDLQKEENRGEFSKVVIITNGRGNAPAEGEYYYPATAESEDDIFATVEHYSDGSWHLYMETNTYAAAYNAHTGIRSGQLTPTTYWCEQPVQSSRSGETYSTSDRGAVFVLLIAIGFALSLSEWLPDRAGAIPGLVIIMVAYIIYREQLIQPMIEFISTKLLQSKAHLMAIHGTLQEHASYLTRRGKSDKK